MNKLAYRIGVMAGLAKLAGDEPPPVRLKNPPPPLPGDKPTGPKPVSTSLPRRFSMAGGFSDAPTHRVVTGRTYAAKPGATMHPGAAGVHNRVERTVPNIANAPARTRFPTISYTGDR